MNNENLLSKAGELHTRRGEVREIAAIDLGSNSFHMIVARIVNGTYALFPILRQTTLRYCVRPSGKGVRNAPDRRLQKRRYRAFLFDG